MSHIDDEQALAALREAATLPAASPFATARAARAFELALDGEQRARRWTTGRVAAIAILAAASAGALVIVAQQRPLEVAVAPVAPVAPLDPKVAPVAVVVSAPKIEPALNDATPSLAPLVDDVVELPKRVQRTASAEAERLVEAGDAEAGARVLVRDLLRGERASSFASLALLARRYPEALLAVDDALARVSSTDAMRLRCQHRLLHARDVSAMTACRAFGQEHPQDGAARVLSFAAGRLAEDLGDLAWAEEEYSRSLLLSPFSGLSGTDALLARARVRFAAGDDGEARADLRLYLHSEPSARRDPAVAALATSLGL